MKHLILVASLLTVAADWPQWLGPHCDGSTTEVIAAWKDAPKILWRAPLDEGHSSPIVADGRVYIHTAVGDLPETEPKLRELLERVAAYDAKSGNLLWRAAMDKKAFKSQFGVGPRATPAVADGRLHCYGVTGNYAAFEVASGKLLTTPVDLVDEHRGKVPFFGVSAAPLVAHGLVFLQVGGPEAGVVAVDAKTGKVAHKYLKDAASYAAMTAVEHDGAKQVVVLNAEGLYGLNPAGDDQFWKYRFKDLLSESSTTPIRAGGLLIGSSVTLGSVGLRLTKKNGKPAVEEVWKNSTLSCYFSTPVIVGDDMYLVTGRLLPPPSATLYCVETATGKVRWSKPNVGKYGAPLIKTGDGKLLLLEESGDLVLVQPSSEKYVELARAKICGQTWAHPAIADGKLYIRDRKELICVQLTP